MENIASKRFILIGAPFVSDAPDIMPDKVRILDVVAQNDFLPIESGMYAPTTSQHYWEVLEQIASSSCCYLLLICKQDGGSNYLSYIRDELKKIHNVGIPVILLIFDDDQLKKEYAFLTEPRQSGASREYAQFIEYWRNTEGLEKAAHSALKKLKRTLLKATEPEILVNLRDPELFSTPVYFQAFYYSAINLEVKDYRLEVGMDKKVHYRGITGYPVREWGFHDHDRDDPDINNKLYEGVAYLRSGYLYFDLSKRQEPHNGLNIRLYFGNANSIETLGSQEVLFGSIQGITSRGANPIFCYKTVLTKRDGAEHDLETELKEQIDRLLHLTRKSFLTRTKTLRFKELKTLKLDSHRVDRGKHLEGVYRVWTGVRSKDGAEMILQTKMVVQKNYRAEIFNPIFGDEPLLCEIHFSKQHSGKDKLIIVMRRNGEEGSGAGDIATVAMMEFPREEEMKSGVFIGSYCSAGAEAGFRNRKEGDTTTEVRGGYFVTKREDLKRRDFQVGLFPVARFEKDRILFDQMLRRLRARNKRLQY